MKRRDMNVVYNMSEQYDVKQVVYSLMTLGDSTQIPNCNITVNNGITAHTTTLQNLTAIITHTADRPSGYGTILDLTAKYTSSP